MTHCFIEGQHERGLNAEGLDGGEALGEVLDEAGGAFGGEHLGGVFSKSNAERRGLELVGIGDGLPENLLMVSSLVKLKVVFQRKLELQPSFLEVK